MSGLFFSRREALQLASCGFGSLALSGMLAGEEIAVGNNPLQAKQSHHVARAKRIIFLFMQGGPSQVDTFDYKPILEKRHGEKMPFDDARIIANTGQRGSEQTLMQSPWKFRQYGECGQPVSELFPHMANHVDKMCMIHSMHTEGVAHGPATLFLHTGATNFVRPSMGSWISYGLGTQNQNLPSYVVLSSGRGPSGGATLWHNGFLPSVHAGVLFRNQGAPILNLEMPPGLPPELERKGLDVLGELNRQRFQKVQDSEISSRIANYELAFRMQMAAPELTDLSGESNAILQSYGVDRQEPEKRSGRVGTGDHYATFGANCLLARRLVERGVRFVNIMFASWDHHSNLDAELGYNAGCVDQPIGALIKDLKQRGLLDDTLVVWGGEFGRTPLGENRIGRAGVTGRDHHPNAFSMFMAGGGAKPGSVYGKTDELGWAPVVDPVHINDFQATLLHMFGMDHRQLTFRHQGIDKRLTSITRESSVINKLLS